MDASKRASFNEHQLRAIEHKTGPAMVIAGPGSGKTTVITNRVAELISYGTARPEEILVITFTVAAAREMEARYLKLVADCKERIAENCTAGAQAGQTIQAAAGIAGDCDSKGACRRCCPRAGCAGKDRQEGTVGTGAAQVTFGTFHSVFYTILKSDPFFRSVRIPAQSESIKILISVVGERYPEAKFTSDYYSYLLQEISRIKNGLVSDGKAAGWSISSWRKDGLNCSSSHYNNKLNETAKCRPAELKGSTKQGNSQGLRESMRMALDIMEEYGHRMLKSGFIDFDDMLTLCHRKLRADAHLLGSLRKRYRFIMVDEFQDINPIQFEVVNLLAAPANNLFVVGDDDQSIYGFRGSEPGIMLSFRDYYPDTARYELFTNYRSSPQIIGPAARLISKNKDRYNKQFNTVREAYRRPVLHCFNDPEAEAAWVIESIKSLPAEFRTVGVLYRTHRAGSRVVRAIEQYNIQQAAGQNESKAGNDGKALNGRKSLRDMEEVGGSGSRDISMMSFHGSKGLEFDAVYIISANDGITPSQSAGEENLEEERRLFYVAVTRAKQLLHISYTKYIYNKQQKRSRFIPEAMGMAAFLPRRK